jgi:hypothetical protein
MQAICAVIAALSLWMGLGAGRFLDLSQRAAAELFDGSAYRAAVLDVPGLKGAEALAAEGTAAPVLLPAPTPVLPPPGAFRR